MATPAASSTPSYVSAPGTEPPPPPPPVVPQPEYLPPEEERGATVRDHVEAGMNGLFTFVPAAFIGAGLDVAQGLLQSEPSRQRQQKHIEGFETRVRQRAGGLLDAHRAQVEVQRRRLLGPGGAAARAQLRGTLRQAQNARRLELSAKADQYGHAIDYLIQPQTELAAVISEKLGAGVQAGSQVYRAQVSRARADEVRALIHKEPALGALSLATIDVQMSDAALEAALRDGLDEAEIAIDDVAARLRSGDIDATSLGKITQDTLQDMGITKAKAQRGEAQSHDVLAHMAREGNIEGTVEVVVRGGTVALGVAGFLIGGPLGAGLAVGGAGLGATHGAVHLEEALDQRDAAYVGLERDDGLADEDEADEQVLWAGAEIGGAIVDLGAAAKVAQVAQVARVAKAKHIHELRHAVTELNVRVVRPNSVVTELIPAKVMPAKVAAHNAPTQITPAKITPAKTTPAKTAPAKITPAKITPAKFAPAKTAAHNASAKIAPVKTAPAKITPAKIAPQDTPAVPSGPRTSEIHPAPAARRARPDEISAPDRGLEVQALSEETRLRRPGQAELMSGRAGPWDPDRVNPFVEGEKWRPPYRLEEIPKKESTLMLKVQAARLRRFT